MPGISYIGLNISRLLGRVNEYHQNPPLLCFQTIQSKNTLCNSSLCHPLIHEASEICQVRIDGDPLIAWNFFQEWMRLKARKTSPEPLFRKMIPAAK